MEHIYTYSDTKSTHSSEPRDRDNSIQIRFDSTNTTRPIRETSSVHRCNSHLCSKRKANGIVTQLNSTQLYSTVLYSTLVSKCIKRCHPRRSHKQLNKYSTTWTASYQTNPSPSTTMKINAILSSPHQGHHENKRILPIKL